MVDVELVALMGPMPLKDRPSRLTQRLFKSMEGRAASGSTAVSPKAIGAVGTAGELSDSLLAAGKKCVWSGEGNRCCGISVVVADSAFGGFVGIGCGTLVGP